MIEADLVVTNIRELLTCAGPAPRIGVAQRDVSAIRDAVLAVRDGRIVFAGSMHSAEARELSGQATYDAAGASVVPGFVDPHTHAAFAGDRREELRRRLAGATYAEIAAAGGGSCPPSPPRAPPPRTNWSRRRVARLDEMLACGTTTCEIKSGYGLDD